MKTLSMFLCNRTKETEEKLVFLINSQINKVKKNCNCVDIDRKLYIQPVSLFYCFCIPYNMQFYNLLKNVYILYNKLDWLLWVPPFLSTMHRHRPPVLSVLIACHIFLLQCTYWISRCFVFNIVPRPSIVNNVFYKELQYC